MSETTVKNKTWPNKTVIERALNISLKWKKKQATTAFSWSQNSERAFVTRGVKFNYQPFLF